MKGFTSQFFDHINNNSSTNTPTLSVDVQNNDSDNALESPLHSAREEASIPGSIERTHSESICYKLGVKNTHFKTSNSYNKLPYQMFKKSSLFHKLTNKSKPMIKTPDNHSPKKQISKNLNHPSSSGISIKEMLSESSNAVSSVHTQHTELDELEHLSWMASNLKFDLESDKNNKSIQINRRYSLQQNVDNSSSSISIKRDSFIRKMSLIDEVSNKPVLDTQNKSSSAETRYRLTPLEMANLMYQDSNALLRVGIDRKKYSEMLGNPAEYYQEVLKHYCSMFKFHMMNLDVAFRLFCSRLYLRAETQAIDRIILQFSNRYYQCNHSNSFSMDYIYAITYAMLLLNTDLHLANNNQKMSRSQFIKNTMLVLPSSRQETSQVMNRSTNSNSSNYRNNTSSGFDSNSNMRSRTIIMLKELYNSIKNTPITKFNLETSQTESAPMERPKTTASSYSSSNSTISSAYTTNNISSLNRTKSAVVKNKSSDIDYSHHEKDQDTDSASQNILKTIVFKKNLFDKDGKRSASRSWKEFILEVDLSKPEVSIKKSDKYTYFGSTHTSDIEQKIVILHSLAVILPNGYSSSRPYVFALQLTSGSVLLFQSRTKKETFKFVNAINYIAAKYSTLPLDGGINNTDYGWSKSNDSVSVQAESEVLSHISNAVATPATIKEHEARLSLSDSSVTNGKIHKKDPKSPVSSQHLFNKGNHNLIKQNSIVISEWKPPAYSEVSSTYPVPVQVKKINEYISKLNKDLENHMDTKTLIDQRFEKKSPFYSKASLNFEKKSQFLLREVIRYQTYVEALALNLE